MKTNANQKPKIGLTWVELEPELSRHKFVVPAQHQANLLNWARFWYKGSEYLAELAAEIAEMGKCQGCEMPEYVIHQEYEAGDMKSHLICSGCQKKCDEGIYKHENDYYSFRHPRCGAYVFWLRNGEKTEEWYCESCKFQLLCGDCGSPHELDTDSRVKPELEDFYLCESCTIKREEELHQENHGFEPDLACSLCQQWAEKWEELMAAREKN